MNNKDKIARITGQNKRAWDEIARVRHTSISRPASFYAAGGTILACGTCVKKRGLDEKDLAPGVAVAGAPALVAFLSAGAPSVSF